MALLLAAPASIPATAPITKPTRARLCVPHEATIFDCATASRRVAVCVDADGRSVQYRAGLPGKVQLASPPRSAGLSHAYAMYSGGGESQVRFTNGDYSYVAYSSTIRTGFGPDGHNDPKFEAGVLVTRGGKLISRRECVPPDNEATLDDRLAEQLLPKGEFQEH